jgi:hypothetical protein
MRPRLTTGDPASGGVLFAPLPLTHADQGAHVDATAGLAVDATPVAAWCPHEVILLVSAIGSTTVLMSAESPTRLAPQPAAVWRTGSTVRQTIPPPGGTRQARCRRHADAW